MNITDKEAKELKKYIIEEADAILHSLSSPARSIHRFDFKGIIKNCDKIARQIMSFVRLATEWQQC